jgi:transposase
MFVKLTKSGPRRYIQLVEAYRDEDGRARQRTVASLGRLESIDQHFESVVRGLERVTGRQRSQADLPPESSSPAPEIVFEPARNLGDVWSLTSLWKELGFDRLARVFRSGKRQLDVEGLLRIMVFNRLCDPESKLGILRWLETVALPDIDTATVAHQHLLRAMDALVEKREAVDAIISGLLRPLIDQELSVVFYDLTTITTDGLTEQADELRRYGHSKDGGIRRQVVLGVVQTADGLPIYHEVFEGNIAEVKTLRATLDTVMARYPIRRVIAVADRGLMSLDNLEELKELRTPSGEPLEFILAVSGRRYTDFEALLQRFQKAQCKDAKEEIVGEFAWNDVRLVVAHDPKAAEEKTAERDRRIKQLEDQAAEWAGKLDDQDAGKSRRGRPLSDGGARARFYHAVMEAKLGKIIRVDLKSELFTYDIDRKARKLAELMDGKLLLVTNVRDLSASDVIARYKSLADIERGFRVLKSEIEIGPVYHRLPDRIRAHAYLCFIALILHRVMRMRLREANAALSPERALETLRRIQHHTVTLGGSVKSGITTLTDEQKRVLASLQVEKPRIPEQLTLL